MAALVAASFLFAAPAAQAARSEFFGVVQGPALDDTDFQAIAPTGVKTARFLFPWMVIEKNQGQRDWSATDQLVGGLASHGIRPVPIAFGSPPWTLTGSLLQPPVNSGAAKLAWEGFLKAAVARYGPGGSYWADGYRQQFGETVAPLPIRSWQVWNEPNLRNQFYPGGTVAQAAQRYAQLLRISHDAIRSKDGQAEIVTAGIATQKDPHAFDFLDRLYSVPGIKGDFDALAQHPYASSVDNASAAIKQVRTVMANHGDQGTPLWITEFGWASAPADGTGINVGAAAQASMLTSSFKLILAHRRAWNVQRLYWFDWRDPAPGSAYEDVCIRCASAGLLRYDRTPKPAYHAFLAFTAETTRPSVSITSGPGQGALTNDPTPGFSFTSNEPGSTFACRRSIPGPFAPCSSPYTVPMLSQGPHTFSVKAIDAAGNESAVVSRSFRVDSRAPAAPLIIATIPGSPANHNAPRVTGSAEAGSTVKLYKTAGCTGAPAATGSAAMFALPGLTATVPDNTTTNFRVTATDAAGNTSLCSAARTYVEDSIGL